MNGLILAYFLKMERIARKPLLLLALLGISISVFASNQTVMYIFMFVFITAAPILFFSLFFADENKSWSRYELLLPIAMEKILLAKFILSLICTIVTLLLLFTFVHVVILFHALKYFDLGYRDVFTILCFALAYCLTIYSLSFFAMYGPLKINSILSFAICTICAYMLLLCVIACLNLNNISLDTGRIIIIIFSALFYIVSYALSAILYKKTEI